MAAVLGGLLLLPGTVGAHEQSASTNARDNGDHNVRLTAVIAKGAKPITKGVKYKIWAMSGPMKGRKVAELDGGSSVALAPGAYRVAARYGAALRVEDFKVSGGKTNHVVNLNSGWVTLRLIPSLESAPIKGDVSWKVLTYGKDKNGKRRTIYEGVTAMPELILSSGHYLVEAQHKHANVDHVIEVTPGQRYTYTINLNAGTMRVYAETAKGVDPATPIVWEIYPAGAKEGSEPLARHVAPKANFTLPGGKYLLVASQGELISKKPVTIRPGNDQEVGLQLR